MSIFKEITIKEKSEIANTTNEKKKITIIFLILKIRYRLVLKNGTLNREVGKSEPFRRFLILYETKKEVPTLITKAMYWAILEEKWGQEKESTLHIHECGKVHH